MLHNDRGEFVKILERTAAQTQFPLLLLEKDYYLTILLAVMTRLSPDLVFKGGTCLNKIYYSYYRLSEDLDFTLKLPDGKTTRAFRGAVMRPISEGLSEYAREIGIKAANLAHAGHNESKQYIYNLGYHSVILNREEAIKLEIGLRFNPCLPAEEQEVKHVFLHPFTQKPLFLAGRVKCLALKEIVAEKMRAAATRERIAPRDFYDLGYLIKAGYQFKDQELRNLFIRKLAEDGYGEDLEKYRINMGRTAEEINGMESRIGAELMDVLSVEERKSFNLEVTLAKINEAYRLLEK